MISVVAETYGLHPQTLRLYERMGLLKPSRSDGNTRLYTDGDLKRLEMILNLTRDMGVNLAGVEVILGLREKMDKMQKEMAEMLEYMSEHLVEGRPGALVRVPVSTIIRTMRNKSKRELH
jgi:MerR family transcriptional regulator/heat shock protein HspR